MPEGQGEIEITLKWKNEDFFEMTQKIDDAEVCSVIRMEENGCLKTLFPHVESICMDDFKAHIDRIGKEMRE